MARNVRLRFARLIGAARQSSRRPLGTRHSTGRTVRSRVGTVRERVDVVVVGARCAGSAAASVLAPAGRRVVVLDRARFPSDTLSTHVLVPGAVIEMARVGALERLLALDVPRCPWVTVQAGEALVREHWGAREGIDYGLCVPRPEQDAELVATARAAGAEVREGCAVDDVVWSCGRVAGVRCGSDEIRASLVIGA